MQIPWTNLTTEPIIIVIEDLYAVLSPKNAEDIKVNLLVCCLNLKVRS